jgi:anti-anti-sigma regulatory factor
MHMDANIEFVAVIEDGSPALVATPVGALEEADAIDVQAQLLAALARAPRRLVLDLSRVTAMDDTVASAFDAVEKYAGEMGCTYRLTNLTPAVAAALYAHHHRTATLRGAQSTSRLDAVAVARRLARRRVAMHN